MVAGANDLKFLRARRDHWSLCESYSRMHDKPMPVALLEEVRDVKTEWEAKHGR